MTDITEFVSPELLVLVPVLYALGTGFKKSGSIKDKHIPLLLGVVGVVLALIWSFGMYGLSIEAVFTGLVQGILISATAVYGNQLYVQSKREE